MIIKVCGLREPENIHSVTALDINWIGLIFYPKSPRYIDGPPNCQLPTLKNQVKKVGVFVNASCEEMMETAIHYKLDYLQLHGNESPDVCHTLQKRGFSLIKAFSIASAEDLKQTNNYEGRVDYFLFDTKCEGFGGSGKSFDWSVLSAYHGNTPFLLSGGLNPESLDAIRNFQHPAFIGIDLNSGFEIKPGLKDIPKLSSFIRGLETNN